jgi:UDP-glucose:(heptosyl)LPS alpha-1,3-glucosyltransferase
LALKLGITSQVEFLGSVKNIQELYQTCDCMILPTKYDAFSNSCLEALSCGCRVITTIQNGASELINESNGLAMDYNESNYCEKAAHHLALLADYKSTFDSRNYENVYGEDREIKEYYEILDSA